MPRRMVTCAAVIVLLMTGSAFAQIRSAAEHMPSNLQLAHYGLERAWWGQATMNIYRDKVRHISLDEDNLYVQSTAGAVTAFDAETGRKRWAVLLGRTDAPSFPAVSNDELVLIVAGTEMFALDKLSGDELWSLELPAQPSTSPGVDRFHVYYGTLDGSIFAFDLKAIHRLHDQNRLPQWSNIALKWRYKTSEEITSPPVISDEVVNFASRDKSLYSITKMDRKLKWQFETDRAISAPLGRADGLLFLGTEDYNVFCITQAKGAVRWQFVAGVPIRRQPRVIGESVYIFPDNDGVYSLSKLSGTRHWWQSHITDFVAASSERLFASDDLGHLAILSRRDGTVLGGLAVRDFSKRLGNDLTDRAYLATASGLVICLREIGKEFPTYHLYPERQPILPEFEPEGAAVPEPPAPGEGPIENQSAAQ